MTKINIVNSRTHASTNNDYYIGRGSVFGNPYTSKDIAKTKALFKCSSKEEAIEKYKTYLNKKILDKDKEICDKLNEMYLVLLKTDINLVCYCSPKKCHGEIIRDILTPKIFRYFMNKR